MLIYVSVHISMISNKRTIKSYFMENLMKLIWSVFGWYGLGLFQLILSHRILFNHPKSAELQCKYLPAEHPVDIVNVDTISINLVKFREK